MPVISLAQASSFAAQAGFTGRSLTIILAIAQAESGLNTSATSPPNSDGSVDRGILQINNKAHPEVSDACAYDAACAFSQGFRISQQGNNFGPWTTYTSGAYLKYTNVTPTISVNSGSSKPWYEYPFGMTFGAGEFGFNGQEHGADLETPIDTPITALLPGTVTDISSPSWGKQVTWKLDQPYNGIPYMYQIHLDAVNPVLQVGSHVNAGDLIGWSGGANSAAQVGNATNPTGTHYYDDPSMSSGPHTEVGFSYGPVYGSGAGYADISQHPELNPVPFLDEVRSGQIPEPQGIGNPSGGGGLNIYGGAGQPQVMNSVFTTSPIALTTVNDTYLAAGENVHETLAHAPGFYGIVSAIDEAEQYPGIYNAFSGDTNPLNWGSDAVMSVMGTIGGNATAFAIRTILIGLGLMLLAALMWNAMKPITEMAGPIAEMAVMAA